MQPNQESSTVPPKLETPGENESEKQFRHYNDDQINALHQNSSENIKEKDKMLITFSSAFIGLPFLLIKSSLLIQPLTWTKVLTCFLLFISVLFFILSIKYALEAYDAAAKAALKIIKMIEKGRNKPELRLSYADFFRKERKICRVLEVEKKNSKAVYFFKKGIYISPFCWILILFLNSGT